MPSQRIIKDGFSFSAIALFILWSLVFTRVFIISIDREIYRQYVACKNDKARGYPVKCEELKP